MINVITQVNNKGTIKRFLDNTGCYYLFTTTLVQSVPTKLNFSKSTCENIPCDWSQVVIYILKFNRIY